MLGLWVSKLKHERCWKGKSNDRKAWILITRGFCDCPVLRSMSLSAGVTAFLVSRLTPTDEFSSCTPVQCPALPLGAAHYMRPLGNTDLFPSLKPAEPKWAPSHGAFPQHCGLGNRERKALPSSARSWGGLQHLQSLVLEKEVTARICPMTKNKAILSRRWLSPSVNQSFYWHLRSPTKTSWALWEPLLSFLSFSLITDSLGSGQGV